MILTQHGINSLRRGPFVEVDGIKYPYRQLGNLFWTTKSLRNLTAHYVMPASGVSKYGLLYQYYYVYTEIMPLLPSGWRIPTQSDFIDLYGVSQVAKDFIVKTKGGNNSTRFSAMLLGYRNKNGSLVYGNTRSCFWSSTTRPTIEFPNKYSAMFEANEELWDYADYSRGGENSIDSTALEVRICKDV